MATYETGAASSVTDLLDKLRIFSTANGWTQNYFGARTAGAGQALQLTKGAQAVTFIADTAAGNTNNPGPYFGAYSHNTYSAGNGTENQAQGSAKCYANAMPGPFQAYHFVTGAERGADYLYVIVEVTAGTYKHAGVGKLVAMGALNTGAFAFGSSWSYNPSSTNDISNLFSTWHAIPFDSAEEISRPGPATQIRADSDGVTPRWYDSYGSGSFGGRFGGGFRATNSSLGNKRGTVLGPVQRGLSAMTGRALLVPCWVYGERASSLASLLGYPPGIRWVRLDNLTPGDILTLGADQWKVFPIIRKNGAVGQVNSAGYGYAYKVN